MLESESNQSSLIQNAGILTVTFTRKLNTSLNIPYRMSFFTYWFGKVFISLTFFEEYLCGVKYSLLEDFCSFSALNVSSHSVLFHKLAHEKCTDSSMEISSYVMICLFPLLLLARFSLIFNSLIKMHFDAVLFE